MRANLRALSASASTREKKRTYQVERHVAGKIPIILRAHVCFDLFRAVHVGKEWDDDVVRPPTKEQSDDNVNERKNLAGPCDTFFTHHGSISKERGIVVTTLDNAREDTIG